VLDLDDFKSVNDDFGHATGDAVLVELARVLDRHVERDTIVRFGGEEIVIVFPAPPPRRRSSGASDCAPSSRARTWDSLPPDRRLTVSIGVAAAPPYDGDASCTPPIGASTARSEPAATSCISATPSTSEAESSRTF
jgi:diguanylate cyclase (GGDEF)-like protein